MNKDYSEIENNMLLYKSKETIVKDHIELLKRIDKAIEYIKGAYEMVLYTKSISLEEENIEELLDILKGDSNE